ncbi:hypothetical protein LIER_15225 [Lithospermum erythrorhizon]|uniref:Uncharacterized protein n=1 Tax=Lithospermum erythrorhizon TaxID=34254 RepID=A0AAV3Q213_LITER
MERNTMLIPQIDSRTRNCTSRITIIEDIPALTAGTGLLIKRSILTDDEENQIAATSFGSHIYILDVVPNLGHFLDNLTPISVIFSNRRPNINNFKIMGAVIAFEDPTNVIVDGKLKKIQRFTFVDMEMIPICITLWEEMTDIQGPLLMEAMNSRAVVVAKRLSLTTYNAKNSSSFTINPPIEAALNFKSWAESRTDTQIQSMLVDQIISRSKQRLNEGNEIIHTVADLQNMTKPGDYWIRRFLQIYEDEQKLSNYCAKDTGAIGSLAERILQITAMNILKLSNLGQIYDLDNNRSDFNERIFLMLLQRSQSASNTSSLLATENTEESSDKGKQPTSHSSPLSPLKCQMSEISINPDSLAKKKMFLEENETNEEGSNSER